MKAIGVRELRQNASRYLAEVAAGESIEITDRGRPVARLVPITGDPWQDLISAGEVVRAARPVNVDDIKPGAYPHSASKFLEELRSNER
jgi:prevent-host-death family protein